VRREGGGGVCVSSEEKTKREVGSEATKLETGSGKKREARNVSPKKGRAL